jgi:hypothetical protein
MFLELPPGMNGSRLTLPSRYLYYAEIRNYIYHFAQEREFDAEYLAPPLLVCRKPISARPDRTYAYSARRFLALTQTCKLIRTEYRPLWLREASISIDLDLVQDFLTAFYPTIEDFQNAPKLLAVLWDHRDGYDEDVLFDITPLLHLRAHCPTFVAKFCPRPLMDGDAPNVTCFDCGHSVHCGCSDNDCDHENAIDEAMFDLEMDYHYTMALDDFIANNNKAWLKAIRDDFQLHSMKVECTVDIELQQLTIHIRFLKGKAPAGFTETSMYKGAMRYLEGMGILDLDVRGKLDFVIGEHTGKYTRHFSDCGYPIPTYNQVHIVSPIAPKSTPGAFDNMTVTTAVTVATSTAGASTAASSSTATASSAPPSTTAPIPAVSAAAAPTSTLLTTSPTAPMIASMD